MGRVDSTCEPLAFGLMLGWRAMAAGCALLATAAHAAGAARPLPVGVTSHTLEMDGFARRYLLFRPQQTDVMGTYPLVLVLHGGGGTALGIAEEVGGRMHELAERDGFFVIYPDAFDRMWDFGAGEVSESLSVRVNDLEFFEQVLDEAVGRLPIDPRRVFATGISRGGQASYFLACWLPGRIRAIAPVTMPLPRFMESSCREGPPVGLAIMNGTKDPLVPYDGGQITVGRRERGEVLSTDATVELWRQRNGCSEQPSERQRINNARDRMHVDRTAWNDCSGAPVVLYRIKGGGHTWPSGRQYLPKFIVGRVNRDIDGAVEAWGFFSRFQ